jgi:hypothetical protein
MLIAQAALLLIPVAKTNRRNIKKTTLIWPLVASGLMMGALTLGAILSIYELFARNESEEFYLQIGALAGLLVWLLWTVLFFIYSRNRDPMGAVSQQCRLLLQGSILELLIAIPIHVVARWRDYCCAGFLTFVGLTFGISVMLFAFGPSVFFLFVARWKQKRPVLTTDQVHNEAET